MDFNFDVENVGKSSIAGKKGSSATAARNNSALSKAYSGKPVIQIPGAPGKGKTATFYFNEEAVNALQFNLDGNDYYGITVKEGKVYILNVTGIITDEAMLSKQQYAKVTKSGTSNSKYYMKMLHRLGFDEASNTVVEVNVLNDVKGVVAAVEVTTDVLESSPVEGAGDAQTQGNDSPSELEEVEDIDVVVEEDTSNDFDTDDLF